MGILNTLIEIEKWEDFYNNRVTTGHMSQKELIELRKYIDEKAYEMIAKGVLEKEYEFSVPRLSYISKNNGKKRIVYQFHQDEVWYLKHLAYRLHKYDNKFADACYSFRTGRNAKTAVIEVLSCNDISRMYCLKADIHDYFNSIPREELCKKLSDFVNDDDELVQFLIGLLSVDLAVDADGNSMIHGNRGAMAGTPISPFLANLYLSDVDRYFEKREVKYLRYADDILIFAESLPEIEKYKKELVTLVMQEGLTINEDKFSV